LLRWFCLDSPHLLSPFWVLRVVRIFVYGFVHSPRFDPFFLLIFMFHLSVPRECAIGLPQARIEESVQLPLFFRLQESRIQGFSHSWVCSPFSLTDRNFLWGAEIFVFCLCCIWIRSGTQEVVLRLSWHLYVSNTHFTELSLKTLQIGWWSYCIARYDCSSSIPCLWFLRPSSKFKTTS
jgi:hypothetical protein